MSKLSEYINRKYHLQVTGTVTISRLALNNILKYYLKDSKLPIIGRNMFSDIKQGYYGRVTEVYKPYGKNLLLYDVNSLYPFAALNPMPGINCSFIENIGNNLDFIKSNTIDKVEKDITKRLLNHLLGRFGMNIIKPVTGK